MKLSLDRPYLSLAPFPEIEVPKFTIIVGLNGSGKSHLLSGIAAGAISNSVVSSERRDFIRLLKAGGEIISQNDRPPISDPHHTTFGSWREVMLKKFEKDLQAISGRELYPVLGTRSVWTVPTRELAALLGAEEKTADVEAVYVAAASALESSVNSHLTSRSGDEYRQVINEAKNTALRMRIPLISLQDEQIRLFRTWGTVDQFKIDLSLVFERYRDSQLNNWMLRKADELNGTNISLSDDGFLDEFGVAPWSTLNATLKDFGLPYEFSQPSLASHAQVSLTLRRLPGGESVPLDNLSSGESVLAHLAISSMSYAPAFVSIRRPELLLLDEMDASLHPEMVNRWLGAIADVFVNKQNMHVVIATHSPTTVALAPAGARIYEMVSGVAGLKEITKQEAVNRLTFGLPTLAIDYQGRRQVFVESDTDVPIYENLFSALRGHLDLDWELNFLPTGIRDKRNVVSPGDAGVEMGAGCATVKQIVGALRDLGVKTTFGIIDWDGENDGDDRVKVVADKVRDGVENVILDPLLVCLLLIHLQRPPAGVSEMIGLRGVEQLSPADLQRMVDAVQHEIFPTYSGVKKKVTYIGGASCEVLEDYLLCDDHDLEKLIIDKYKVILNGTKNSRGKVPLAVVLEVVRLYPEFCPTEIKDVFEAIGNQQVDISDPP